MGWDEGHGVNNMLTHIVLTDSGGGGCDRPCDSTTPTLHQLEVASQHTNNAILDPTLVIADEAGTAFEEV